MREMAPCMAMGESAGTACSQVVKRNISFAQVNPDVLRRTLREHGAVVDWDVEVFPLIFAKIFQIPGPT